MAEKSRAGEKRAVETARARPLLEFIEKNRISQTVFAKEIDEAKQTLTNWKTRGIPLHAVAKVAARMGWTYEQYVEAAAGKKPATPVDPGLSFMAADIAKRWMELSPDRQDWFKDLLFSIHLMEERFPAMKKGRPKGEHYTSFEAAVVRDMEEQKKQKQIR